MKQNMLVVSYDYQLSKSVAKSLAEVFSMRFFDQRELFEFDHVPLSFADTLKQNGIEYIKKKFKSILKMELDFTDSVMACDICFADNAEDLFYNINQSNFVIYLKQNTTDAELLSLEKQNFENKEVASFYQMSKDTI